MIFNFRLEAQAAAEVMSKMIVSLMSMGNCHEVQTDVKSKIMVPVMCLGNFQY